MNNITNVNYQNQTNLNANSGSSNVLTSNYINSGNTFKKAQVNSIANKNHKDESGLNNSRSKSRNNNESPNTGISHANSNLTNYNPKSTSPNSGTVSSNSNNIHQKNSNMTSNTNDATNKSNIKKSILKEGVVASHKKDYSTSLNENTSFTPYSREEKTIKTHISTKSINYNNDKIMNNFDTSSMTNSRISPNSHMAPFKKYSVSPNQKNPLETVIIENSDLFEEDNFDPTSYRERGYRETKYSNNSINSNNNNNINNMNNYSASSTYYINTSNNEVNNNKTQKMIIRSSNTPAHNINTINPHSLGNNHQSKLIKAESRILNNNNTNSINSFATTNNSNNNFNPGNKKNATLKKTLTLNNNLDGNLGQMVNSVKNSNTKSSLMNSTSGNFTNKTAAKNSSAAGLYKESKELYKSTQGGNMNISIKNTKYKTNTNVSIIK